MAKSGPQNGNFVFPKIIIQKDKMIIFLIDNYICKKNLLKFVPIGFKLYWAGIVSSITLLSSSNVLKFLIKWKIPIIGVFVLSRCVTKWKRNSCEKTFKNIYTRNWGVQEWGCAHCKATTCKSCANFGILHWKWWKMLI